MPALASIYLVAVVVLGFCLFRSTSHATKYFRQVFRKYDDLNASVQENVSAIRVVKAYVREDYEKGTLHKSHCKPLQNVCGRREGADSECTVDAVHGIQLYPGDQLAGSKDDRRKHADDRRSDEPSGILYEYPDEPDDAVHDLRHADHESRASGQNVSCEVLDEHSEPDATAKSDR